MSDESLRYLDETTLRELYQTNCQNLAWTLVKINKQADNEVTLKLNHERNDILQRLAHLETEFEYRGLQLPKSALAEPNSVDSQASPAPSNKTFNFNGNIGRVNISDTYNEYSNSDSDSSD